ncbi:MAG: hypothetical protein IPP90_12915 [Gemmatimonadaceae bacterium]|nr:hypothetical protein [Gemmatimonadaceae bacterium]
MSATVTVDTTTQFQTMTGWEAVAQGGQASPGFPGWQASLMDLAANDLGLNRIRLEVRSGAENPVDYYLQMRSGVISDTEWRARRYAPVNDNADAASVNANGYHWGELDEAIDRVVLPMRQRLVARGEQLYVNLTYVAFDGPTIHTENAAEYAEFMLAAFQHMQSAYGFVPNSIEVILEPDNIAPWTGTHIGSVIAATGQRLAAAGYTPEFIAPSVTNMANTVPYFDAIWSVAGARTYLKEIAYHRYSGVSDANLAAIRSRAAQFGLRTAQLEHIGSGVEDLYKDLTIANASAWQQFALGFPGVGDNGAQYYTIDGNQPVAGSQTKEFKQYFQYVRFGARRVAAASSSSGVRPVAFTNPGGGAVVVVHLVGRETLLIKGLRPGRYLITATPASVAATGEAQADANGELRLTATGGCLLTVSRAP